jgi:hypothetical protein
MNIERIIDHQLTNHFKKYRQVLILLGARQVGKTTVIRRLFPDAKYFLMDNEDVQTLFEHYDISTYQRLIGRGPRTIVLDEAQRLFDPGRAAKIIYDQMPDVRLIITGSSALNIKNKTAESLAGRKIDYQLYPLTFSEHLYQMGVQDTLNTTLYDHLLTDPEQDRNRSQLYPFDLPGLLASSLIYGDYPHLLSEPSGSDYLKNLADSVVFQDLLELNLVENRTVARSLLKLLAFQIGNLVNYSDLSNRLGADARTIQRYIDIFEQSFLIYRLYPFSSNRRDEIGKTPKVYFHDLGLRNALIDDFSDIQLRNDRGALFENFIVNEALRGNDYGNHRYHLHYWRAQNTSEVDLVLQKVGELRGAEISFTAKSLSRAFTNRYSQAKLKLITSNNFYASPSDWDK